MRKRMCGCGLPVHYTDRIVEAYMDRIVAERGPTIPVTAPGGSFHVSRDYIALHGLKANELPELAARYGWHPVVLDD